jgi:DNA-binding PadR family transcriptional regulator
MKYSTNKTITLLSNVELVLLEIIAEFETISGYEVGKLIEARGYRNWADIGTTSIYIGLNKLLSKSLAESELDTKKSGKGPLPKKFSLTTQGVQALRDNIIDALANSRERDRRFDLGIAGLSFVKPDEAASALEIRKNRLREIAETLEQKRFADGGESLPLHAKYLFDHTLHFIKSECEFINHFMNAIRTIYDENQ